MSIFLLILTGLTTLFASGARAEMDLNRRFEAQQNARLALDKLRRELHCSSGIGTTNDTPLPTTPADRRQGHAPVHCPTAGGVNVTVIYDTVLVSANRWKLQRTKSGGAAVPVADYLTNDDVFHVGRPVHCQPWPASTSTFPSTSTRTRDGSSGGSLTTSS